ncbi:hypothetical protein B6N60_03631 [Richelia sinica FACHB-800]|uniref:Uncharacterized protein n=1 Tax=Richelia sinica FACHB-800 TaxID=1357546 RepID=A0A975T9X5_9NOST|nr:hypothetical protein B6N60_03631 [Richelia sinica FACHB-800]
MLEYSEHGWTFAPQFDDNGGNRSDRTSIYLQQSGYS